MSNGKRPSYKEIACFFLPLSATNLMLTLSHSIVNAGVARTSNPEVALAAYALARSLVRMIENPVFMVRQTVASLVKDQESYRQVRRFVYILTACVMAVIALLGFTPLGLWVLETVMGASPEVAAESHMALGILFLLPFAAVTRNLYHGIAIISRQTMMVPKSSLIRLVLMSGLIFSLALYTELPGAVSASISFVGAFMAEAMLMRWRAKPLLRDGSVLPKRGTKKLAVGSIARFFLPLVLTTLVATAFGPLINAGLARSMNPTIALSAFAVGNALGQIFVAPMNMLHQCTLAFTSVGVPITYMITRRFVIGFAMIASVLLAVISFSPIGTFLLETLIGISGEAAESAQKVMQVKSLLPLALGWREYLWGIFMQQHMTKLIGSGKAVNLVVLVGVLSFLLVGRIGNPAAAGAWGMVIGEFAECLYMQIFYRRTKTYAQSRSKG